MAAKNLVLAFALLAFGATLFGGAPTSHAFEYPGCCLNLSNWTAESYPEQPPYPNPSWTLDPASVWQPYDAQPTLFYSDSALPAATIEMILHSSSDFPDDDFIGFALGFQPGDTSNPLADYLLVDWKRATESADFNSPASCTPGSTASAGLSVSRVLGQPTPDEFWGHADFDSPSCSGLGSGLQELARGTTLGSSGWQPGGFYSVVVRLNATHLTVWVGGAQEVSLDGDFQRFQNGRFAFYNFSQPGAAYFYEVAPSFKLPWQYGTSRTLNGGPHDWGANPSTHTTHSGTDGSGLDFSAPDATPLSPDSDLVYAMAEGDVYLVGPQNYGATCNGYANVVKVRHAGGWEPWYLHLSSFSDQFPPPGNSANPLTLGGEAVPLAIKIHVLPGQLLGRAGTSGACGKHLHVELCGGVPDGVYCDLAHHQSWDGQVIDDGPCTWTAVPRPCWAATH